MPENKLQYNIIYGGDHVAGHLKREHLCIKKKMYFQLE